MVGIVATTTTVYLLVKKRLNEIPHFVKWQMLLLHVYWISFLLYFWRFDEVIAENEKSQFDNLLATIADLCLVINQWIFLEQFLSASFMLPIAIESLSISITTSAEVSETRIKNNKDAIVKAKCRICVAKTVFYAVTITWCLTSSFSGSYKLRFAILVIYLFMAAIFIWSVLRIQKVIKENATAHKYFPKQWLINTNLIIYAVFSIFWTFCYVMIFFWEDASKNAKTESSERFFLFFGISYILIVLTELVRACIFCFMSTRVSIEL